MKELTVQNVEEVFKDCLFQDGEDTTGFVAAEGIRVNVGFHPQRLATHKTDIADMLNQLPDEFQKRIGGGWTFLNACNRKDGQQWGEHQNMEQLVLLGLASGMVEYMLPRERWAILPGGMPYFGIDTSEDRITPVQTNPGA